jgi:hypothetical protein
MRGREQRRMSGDEFDTVFQAVARRSYPSVLGELVGRGIAPAKRRSAK